MLFFTSAWKQPLHVISGGVLNVLCFSLYPNAATKIKCSHQFVVAIMYISHFDILMSLSWT